MNKILFSSENDEWGTPDHIYNALNNVYNFTLDTCASPKEGILVSLKDSEELFYTPSKCTKYFTKEDDGLKQDWGGESFFTNNPYSNMFDWIMKCYKESRKDRTKGVTLCPARTETKWMEIAWKHASNIFFYKKRIQFLKNRVKKNSATFPSVVIEWDYRVFRDETTNKLMINENGIIKEYQRYIGLVDHDFNRLS